MPTIPRSENIQRLTPAGQAPVARVDMRNVGVAGQALAQATRDVMDSTARYQKAQASTEFLKAKARLDNEFDDDQDYETIPDRYEEGLREAREESAEMISSPLAEQEFRQDADVRLAQGRERIEDLAWQKERQYQRAYVDNNLDTALDMAASGNIGEATSLAEELVTASIEKGYIDPEEGEQRFRRWQDDAALGRLQTFAPEDRVEALQQDWAQNLPEGTQAELMREAENARMAGQAQSTVDQFLQEGLSQEQARERVREDIEDSSLREETERRLDYEYGQQRQQRQIRNKEIHQEWFPQIRRGEATVDDIPREVMDSLDPSMQENLYAAEQRAAGTSSSRSDRQVLYTLHEMRANADSPADYRQLNQYFVENSSRLSQSDFDTWAEVATDGSTPVQTESTLDADEYIINRLEDAGLPQEDASTLRLKHNRWHQSFMDREDRAPNFAEREAFVDRQMKEYDFGLFSSSGRVYDMDEDDRQRYVDNLAEEDPTGLEIIENQLGAEANNLDTVIREKERLDQIRRALAGDSNEEISTERLREAYEYVRTQ